MTLIEKLFIENGGNPINYKGEIIYWADSLQSGINDDFLVTI
jgi:hypothetical protein